MDTQRAIADLAFLSDCRGGALVDRTGAVVWWCPERFDGDAWFARLLGRRGGVWRLTPRFVRSCERVYEEDSLFCGRDSSRRPAWSSCAKVCSSHRVRAGTTSAGRVPRLWRARCAARPAASRSPIASSRGAPTASPPPATSETDCSCGRMARRRRSRWSEVMTSRIVTRALAASSCSRRMSIVTSSAAGAPRSTRSRLSMPRPGSKTPHRLALVEELHKRPEGLAADEISFAVRILQGLTYQRSGAIIAAPVASLPETVGGAANWDYRYAWLRDSSLVVHALKQATCADEAERYLAWMARVAHDGEPDGETQAVFGVEGERILTEATLDHLEGFAGSHPVRIGNAAWEQRQLDVYGHIWPPPAATTPRRDFDPVVQRFLCQVATRAARGWHRPDHGIWERRGEPRHHTSSKLACWVALGQALAFSDALGEDRDPLEWAAQRDAARDWLESAWDETRQAFPAWPGSDDVDASMLLFVVNGFLAPDDPRGASGCGDGRERARAQRASGSLVGKRGRRFPPLLLLARAGARRARRA